MYRVYGLRLGPNFEVWPAGDKHFYLRLIFEKMIAFAFFTENNLWPYGCSGTNFTATGNCTNSKTEMQTKIIEMQMILIQF